MLKLSNLTAGAMFILGAIFALPANAETPAQAMDATIGTSIEQGAAEPLNLNEALESLIVEGVVIGLASDEAGDNSDDDSRAHRTRGSHSRSSIPTCSRCRVFRDRNHCQGGTNPIGPSPTLINCVGHCKRNGQLFNCRAR